MRTSTIVLDVNETLSDLRPLSQRFVEVGLPAEFLDTWFAEVLRDGFALTMTHQRASFPALAEAVLQRMLAGSRSDDAVAAATEHVMGGFGSLNVHPDVAPGLRALHRAGFRLVTLTNGSAAFTESLLDRAGVHDVIDRYLSVDSVGVWKPDHRAYTWAAEQLGERVGSLLMVAVHPWDTAGASHAGLQSAWINRDEGVFPTTFRAPDITARDLVDLSAKAVR
ncbi:MAG: haloacid dehalogenase type II [Candidatus Nanopelagicales bacterium]|nr:haloacid dehalogenase type II [Candidatus Nanopelagicales bacterium]